MRARLVLRAAPCAVVLLLAIAAPAAGATQIGSNLSHPANQNYCGVEPGGQGACTHSNSSIATNGLAASGLTAPFNGVVVSWTIKTGSSNAASTSANLRIFQSNLAIRSGSAHPLEANKENTFQERLQIQQGDRLATDILFSGSPGTTMKTLYDAVGAGFLDTWMPPLTDGTSAAPINSFDYELLLRATIEPDTDGDAFGDETQDQCPTDPNTQAACATKDLTAPNLVSASLSNRTFAIDKAGSVTRKRRKAPKGTLIRFTLSEAGTVTATIERARKGHKRKGKCKTKAKKGKRCTIYKVAGSFSFAGTAGGNQKPFSGRLKSKNLKPGSYRMELAAVDAAGNKSKRSSLKFKVVR